jgi:hypothetical protein
MPKTVQDVFLWQLAGAGVATLVGPVAITQKVTRPTMLDDTADPKLGNLSSSSLWPGSRARLQLPGYAWSNFVGSIEQTGLCCHKQCSPAVVLYSLRGCDFWMEAAD